MARWDDCNAAIRIDDTRPEAFANRALVFATQQQFLPALADYERALQLEPSHWNALIGRGMCRIRSGMAVREGIEDLRRAYETAPNSGATRWRC